MSVLPRYIATTVLAAVVLVGLVLTALYTTIDLVREAGSLEGDYGVGLMLVYLVKTIPTRLYDLFPFVALIGTLMALGMLAASREITAMRAGGFDRNQITAWALAAALVPGLAVMLMGEALVPELEAGARIERQQARSGQIRLTRDFGLWLRDGGRMIRIDRVIWDEADGASFVGVTVYRLGEGMRPEAIVHAPRADHRDGEWVLADARRLELGPAARDDLHETVNITSSLQREVFAALATRPRLMALNDLSRMVDYLEANGLDADAYRHAFWRRVFYPVYLAAMVLVGIPLVFRAGRDFSPGMSVFAGIVLGLGFVIVNRTSQGLAMVWPLPFWFSALLPALAFGLGGYALLRRL